jgi:hypothetical protein
VKEPSLLSVTLPWAGPPTRAAVKVGLSMSESLPSTPGADTVSSVFAPVV